MEESRIITKELAARLAMVKAAAPFRPAADTDDVIERAMEIADILWHFYGDKAGDMLDSSAVSEFLVKAFDESKIRRNPKGKVGGGRFANKNSAEDVESVHGSISELLTGPKDGESFGKIVDHLSRLTLGELKDIKQKYQMKASGRTKHDLVAKIAKRLDSGRRVPSGVDVDAPEDPQVAQHLEILESMISRGDIAAIRERDMTPALESKVIAWLKGRKNKPWMKEIPGAKKGYETTEKEEGRIWTKKNEELVTIDPKTGDVTQSIGGDSANVRFGRDESLKMFGQILTHNHPSGLKHPVGSIMRRGNSFSVQDFMTAFKVGCGEFRAVTPTWEHVMRVPRELMMIDTDRLKLEFDQSNSEVRSRFEKQIDDAAGDAAAGKINQKGLDDILHTAQVEHYHDVMLLLQKKYGFFYERRKRNVE